MDGLLKKFWPMVLAAFYALQGIAIFETMQTRLIDVILALDNLYIPVTIKQISCCFWASFPCFRYKLMVLNRCLVLQFPEFGVPWFHQNYCRWFQGYILLWYILIHNKYPWVIYEYYVLPYFLYHSNSIWSKMLYQVILRLKY